MERFLIWIYGDVSRRHSLGLRHHRGFALWVVMVEDETSGFSNLINWVSTPQPESLLAGMDWIFSDDDIEFPMRAVQFFFGFRGVLIMTGKSKFCEKVNMKIRSSKTVVLPVK